MVDFGDAPVVPADAARSHEAIEATVGQVLAAGAIPIVLGGDHSIAEPDIRACAAKHGPLGLVHFDTHTDTGTEVFGLEVSHGTPMYRLVEEGSVDPKRYVQIGLRGYWPGPKEFSWQAQHGIRSFFAHDVRERRDRGRRRADARDRRRGPVFLSIDVDVLDPAFAPGTGTPEPGGLTSSELLWATRTVAAGLERRRRGRRRGDPDCGRLGGHHGPRRGADGSRGDDGHRFAAPLESGNVFGVNR